MTRDDRIKAFHDLLHEFPAGPERDAAIARLGMTELDFAWLHKDNELAANRDEAMAQWYEEQQEARINAWRQPMINCLMGWSELKRADRRSLCVTMRDFFQTLVEQFDADP